jgi:hypothetical protein
MIDVILVQGCGTFGEQLLDQRAFFVFCGAQAEFSTAIALPLLPESICLVGNSRQNKKRRRWCLDASTILPKGALE